MSITVEVATSTALHPNGEQIRLPVGLIGWSQNAIEGTFREGRDVQEAIKALRALPHGQRERFIETYFPSIHVVEFEEQGWIALDNRRLLLYRSLVLPTTEISVQIATDQETQELRRKLLEGDEGATIVIRANRRA
ncbi:hypothetical protein FISHEDRAFT_56549 [Fistulina hepatica ATCC 64428]|uniref:Uncharacterized protein n=1 Tax=Fistulina hepatica ATCC 64428 TaxID=1128425 RepID=A0A0D7ALH2_9AGAR|nr:hypothetical protein FISHEDRAFT_56549 [Fistulina hepatica ATCC 64428]